MKPTGRLTIGYGNIVVATGVSTLWPRRKMAHCLRPSDSRSSGASRQSGSQWRECGIGCGPIARVQRFEGHPKVIQILIRGRLRHAVVIVYFAHGSPSASPGALRDLSIQPRGRSWPGSSLGRQKVALLTRVWVLSAQSLASGATRWFCAAGTRRPLHDHASHASDVRNSAKMW